MERATRVWILRARTVLEYREYAYELGNTIYEFFDLRARRRHPTAAA